MRLTAVIDELVEERGLDKEVLASIICEGMLAAYQKKYPDLPLRARYDKKSDDIAIEVEKKIVQAVQNPEVEMSARKARNIDEKYSVGDAIWFPFEGTIGRVDILRAKQVIAAQIRKIEATAVYDKFKDKEGTIVHGVIHKCEYGGVAVKIQDYMAFLPKSLMSPADKCVPGYPIRALLKEVLLEPRHENQLILDRASDAFILRLFELEIPEVFEKLVEIKKIARSAGYKTKIVVASNDKNIDPVGTCVGVGGVRIKPILKELGGEKIDVLPWDESPETMVRNALKPAVVGKVIIKGNKALVQVDEDQRSLAIGKSGKNISLASSLCGLDIELVQDKQGKESNADIDVAMHDEAE